MPLQGVGEHFASAENGEQLACLQDFNAGTERFSALPGRGGFIPVGRGHGGKVVRAKHDSVNWKRLSAFDQADGFAGDAKPAFGVFRAFEAEGDDPVLFLPEMTEVAVVPSKIGGGPLACGDSGEDPGKGIFLIPQGLRPTFEGLGIEV